MRQTVRFSRKAALRCVRGDSAAKSLLRSIPDQKYSAIKMSRLLPARIQCRSFMIFSCKTTAITCSLQLVEHSHGGLMKRIAVARKNETQTARD